MIKCNFRFVSISPFFSLSTFHLFFFCLCAPDCADGHCHHVWVVFGSGARLDSREEASVCRKILGRMTRWAQDNGLEEGPLVVRCGEAKAHWVALKAAENWKFTTNTWRQKVGRTQPEIGILQWEYRVGIWCQYDENMDPSSFTWTLQAVITANLDAVSDCVHTFMTTVDHLLLDQPEGKCISGTVCSLFSSCFVFWSHNFKRLSASLIPNQ